MPHKHSVHDTDTHFIIDGITRAVKNASGVKTMLVQGDHNSERFTFELPRMIDGHDISLCNDVKVHYTNIDSKTREENHGVYVVDDLQIFPADDEVVVLSWLISSNATQHAGGLLFGLSFRCLSEDGAIEYAWNTVVHKGVSVSSGINNSEFIVEEFPDVIAQLEARIQAVEKGQKGGSSTWAATIAHAAIDETYLEKSQILGIGERDVQVNDLVLYQCGKVGRVVEVLDDAVNTVYTGINLGSVIVEETDEEILIPDVVQTTGDSEDDVMSQKAVTEALKNAGSFALTEKDKTDIACIVLEMLGEHIGGYVDENCQIITTDELPDGEYTFEYEMEDGSTLVIGYGVEEVAPTVKNGVVAENGDLYYYTEDELTFAGLIDYNGNYLYFGEDGKAVKDGRFDVTKTNDIIEAGKYRFDVNGYLVLNEIPISTNADGSLFVGTNGEAGYKTNTRLSSSSGNESTQTGVEATGFIPVTYNDTICLKNLTISTGGTNIFCLYDKDFNWLVGMYSSALTAQEEADGVYKCRITAIDNNKLHGQNSPHTGLPIKDEVAYMRVSADEIDGNSVITIYQPVVEEVEE
jgi:hypothetical protein